MKWALWRKTINDSWLLTVAAGALVFVFSLLYVFMGSQFEDDPLTQMLDLLPDIFTKVTPIPPKDLVTPLGRVAGMLIDPTMILTLSLWAVARGSDAVSGEINRGTMEMLLAQPVRRYQIVLVQAIVSTIATALLSALIIVGVWLGWMFAGYKGDAPLEVFSRGIVNLFAVNFCIVGVTTLLSSFDRYRWRTLALGGGFVIVQLIIKVLSRLRESFEWMRSLTIFGAYEPWPLIAAKPDEFAELWLRYNGSLLAIGLATFVLATIIFCRRDIPAPL